MEPQQNTRTAFFFTCSTVLLISCSVFSAIGRKNSLLPTPYSLLIIEPLSFGAVDLDDDSVLHDHGHLPISQTAECILHLIECGGADTGFAGSAEFRCVSHFEVLVLFLNGFLHR
jgi:hypothetical protein